MKDNLGESLRVGPLVAEYFYMFNLRDGQPLADERVREALSLAVRREVITDRILGMGQRASYWYVPRATEGGTHGSLALAEQPMEQRLARAKRLMREAGYGPDNPLRVTLRYNTLEDHKKIAVAVAAMWKPLGVEVELINAEAAVHYATVNEATSRSPATAWSPPSTTPTTSSTPMPRAAPPSAALAIATRTTTPGRAQHPGAGHRTPRRTDDPAEQMLLDDHALLPLYDYVSAHLVAPEVKLADHRHRRSPTALHPARGLAP